MNEKTAQFSLRGLFQPRDLTEGTPWKTILAFALPIIISYLLQQVYTISDAAIVGQTLTAGEVAGVNDTTSIIFIFLQFAFGVSAGFCVVTAAEVGAHHEAGVRRSLAAQILLSAALTVLLLEFAAFAFRGGAPRLLMPASTMSVILCAAALAARPTLAEILFYAGGACIALGIGAAADFDP